MTFLQSAVSSLPTVIITSVVFFQLLDHHVESVGYDGGHEDQGEDEDEDSGQDELDVQAGRLPLLLPHLALVSSVSEAAGVLHTHYYLTTRSSDFRLNSPWKPQGQPWSAWAPLCHFQHKYFYCNDSFVLYQLPTAHCCKHYNYKIENILRSIIKPEGQANDKLQYNIYYIYLSLCMSLLINCQSKTRKLKNTNI